jgi:vesicle-fusing ATPase
MDNIERIIDWVPIGPRFSNAVLQTVVVLLRKQPPKGRKLLILATTTQRSVLQQLDIFNSFDSDIPVPNVKNHAELSFILKQSGDFSDQDIYRALGEIREMTRSEELGVGVKKILSGIETAKQDEDKAGRFAAVIARTVAERGFE